MNLKELDRWYSIKEYDPENKELSKILKLAKPENKDILITGTYGVLHFSFKLLKYAKPVTAIHQNKKLISYCRKKSKKIKFFAKPLSKTGFPKESFDVVISLWAGLHYEKNKRKIIREMKRILKTKGTLLIEEADETSEFVRILDYISPKKKSRIKKKREELKQVLEKEFGNVKESKLSTWYHFKNKSQAKKYFEKEIVFEEKKRFTKEMERRLEEYLSRKKTLKIGEKSVFFVCRKEAKP